MSYTPTMMDLQNPDTLFQKTIIRHALDNNADESRAPELGPTYDELHAHHITVVTHYSGYDDWYHITGVSGTEPAVNQFWIKMLETATQHPQNVRPA